MKNKLVKGQAASQSRHYESIPKKRRESPVAAPDVQNMDELATMTDDVLVERLRSLETDREKVLDAKCDSRQWEVELSYIRRELQLRRTRHFLHEAYLNGLDREAADQARLENQYPVADLDNSEFMFFN